MHLINLKPNQISRVALTLLLSASLLCQAGQINVFALGELEIDSCTDLQAVGSDAGEYAGWTLAEDYILTKNIDCSGVANFDPIGSAGSPFTGTFNGQGHTVIDLTISRPTEDNVALFAASSGATISDLFITGNLSGRNSTASLVGEATNSTVTDIYSSASLAAISHPDEFYTYLGGIAGVINSTSITNGYFAGALAANGGAADYIDGVGGLVGGAYDGSAITGSIATATTAFTDYADGGIYAIGGLVGYLHDSTVTTSWAEVDMSISGTVFASNIGGLVGEAVDSTVSRSYSEGEIDASADFADAIGGLVGYMQGPNVTNTYSTVDISTGGGGGLVGALNTTEGTISSSYSTGSVTASGSDGAGSFLGYLQNNIDQNITNSFATGPATIADASRLGAIAGREYSTPGMLALTNTYYDSLGTGLTNCVGNVTPDPAGCTGVNTVGSPDANYFKGNNTNQPMAAWDFGTIWTVVVADYPTLQGMPSLPASPDITSPSVTSVTPVDDAVDQAVNTNIVINFSEAMATASVTVTTDPVAAVTNGWTNGDTTLTLNPNSDLAASTLYTISVTAGTDADGNDLDTLPYTWSFTTAAAEEEEDVTSPTVTSVTPVDDAVDQAVDTNIVINFTEAMATGSLVVTTDPVVAVTSAWTNGNATLTLNPNSDLAAATLYTISITDGTDVAENDLTGMPYTWSFTTAAAEEVEEEESPSSGSSTTGSKIKSPIQEFIGLFPIVDNPERFLYSAQWVDQAGNLSPDGKAHEIHGKAGSTLVLELSLKNTGLAWWYPQTPNTAHIVKLGTWDPQDGNTPMHHLSWLSANRITKVQRVVATGETYTFLAQMTIPDAPTGTQFKLAVRPVAEYVKWFGPTGIFWNVIVD